MFFVDSVDAIDVTPAKAGASLLSNP